MHLIIILLWTLSKRWGLIIANMRWLVLHRLIKSWLHKVVWLTLIWTSLRTSRAKRWTILFHDWWLLHLIRWAMWTMRKAFSSLINWRLTLRKRWWANNSRSTWSSRTIRATRAIRTARTSRTLHSSERGSIWNSSRTIWYMRSLIHHRRW